MSLTFEQLNESDALFISKEINITSNLDNASELYFIEVSSQTGYWPDVHMRINEDGDPQHLMLSVIALAQYFLQINPYFYRDLPLHMLAMRKFYLETLPYSDEDSIIQAPAFALDTALKFIESLKQAH